MEFLRHTVDAMSYSKLNVLHWHAVDSQSFALETDSYPLLSQRGSFKPHSHLCHEDTCVYSKADMAGLVAYARDRGIRVIVEIDSPGHAKSWGQVSMSELVSSFCVSILHII
jgi:hexosaminidase